MIGCLFSRVLVLLVACYRGWVFFFWLSCSRLWFCQPHEGVGPVAPWLVVPGSAGRYVSCTLQSPADTVQSALGGVHNPIYQVCILPILLYTSFSCGCGLIGCRFPFFNLNLRRTGCRPRGVSSFRNGWIKRRSRSEDYYLFLFCLVCLEMLQDLRSEDCQRSDKEDNTSVCPFLLVQIG